MLGVSAVRGIRTAEQRADLERLKSVMESVTQVRVAAGAQRVASPDSTPKSFVWNVWRVPRGGGRAFGRRCARGAQ